MYRSKNGKVSDYMNRTYFMWNIQTRVTRYQILLNSQLNSSEHTNIYTKIKMCNHWLIPQMQGLRETSSWSVNANDRSWCFSTQFGFGCLDSAFLNNCRVKTQTGRKGTPTDHELVSPSPSPANMIILTLYELVAKVYLAFYRTMKCQISLYNPVPCSNIT